ncbi:hypothetical protein K501DRAFT_271067 [Backusella circina FSU 941]|nr:hypothetical protein K501DRAFT_271067 [Backusella circina FSU 941]
MFIFVKKFITYVCILKLSPNAYSLHLFQELSIGHTERCLEEISVPSKERYVYANGINNDDPNLNLTDEHEFDGFFVYENMIKHGGKSCGTLKSKHEIKSKNKIVKCTPKSIKRSRSSIYDTMEYRYALLLAKPSAHFEQQKESKEERFVVVKEHIRKYPYEAGVARGLAHAYDALKQFFSWK